MQRSRPGPIDELSDCLIAQSVSLCGCLSGSPHRRRLQASERTKLDHEEQTKSTRISQNEWNDGSPFAVSE